MAGSWVDFVEDLIFGNGLAPNPNHRDTLAAGLPSGSAWLTHYLDRMLATDEAWLANEGLPPITPWDGLVREEWNPSSNLPLGPDLDGSFTGVATLDTLGQALRNRLSAVASVARELEGEVRAPFSYRFWSYLKWAKGMRMLFLGQPVFPTGTVYDRDGTPLSASLFTAVFNDLHRSWHLGSTASGTPTPGLRTTAGQRSSRGVPGMPGTEEFLRFHREHMELFHAWLARTGQPPLVPHDMGRPGGWPPPPGAPPWTPPSPWAEDEASVTPTSALAGLPDEAAVGIIESGYHVSGHHQNSDIGPLSHNNHVPRFHNWHGWIDSQWWWREPRFAASDPVTGVRTRVFRPVRADGSEFPGLPAVSIVRDPTAPADTIAPATAVGGIDLATGAGTLGVKLRIDDPFARPLRLRLVAEVLDGSGAVVPGATVTVLRSIGPGLDHPFDTDVVEAIVFPDAFRSDDPTRAAAAVGFVNGRIRITGTLWVPSAATPDDPTTSPDGGFVHEDACHLDLVREKMAPEAVFYQNLSSFSEDQVTAAATATGTTEFADAFFLVTQDRLTPSVPTPAWPPLVADEVKGLVLGRQAASGMFDDVAHAPEVVLWQDIADAPFTGVTVKLLGPPDHEDASLPPELAQRLTWHYALVFAPGHDAFAGLPMGGQRMARLRATVRDRAGNANTVQVPVKLFRAANPYMLDGPVPWLSIDTRVVAVRAGETRLGETLAAGNPLGFLTAVLNRLNTGTTGAETFDTLAESGPGAALEYATELLDRSTGVSTPIFDFAFAKVRLQGTAGAASVRAFFRLFRYAEPNLLFDSTRGYRSHDTGTGTVVPLLGFDGETTGAPLRSIPFFAEPRVPSMTASMQTQTDANNVHTFSPGIATEQVWYFGVWLDVNDPTARVPVAYQAGAPDGPFPVAALQSLRTAMRDHHQCMVVEIMHTGDPTDPMVSPATSDNLAQRNLVVLESSNPGGRATRTVEHSFEIDLARLPVRPPEDIVVLAAEGHPHECPGCGDHEHDDDGSCARCGGVGADGPVDPGAGMGHGFVSSFAFERLAWEEAMSLAMRVPHQEANEPDDGHEHSEHKHAHEHGGHHEEAIRLLPVANRQVRRTLPFVFHPTRWTETTALVDELAIRWNDLPPGSEVRLWLAGATAEHVVSLRNLRHAPPTVHAEGDGVLRLDVTEVTYLPIPPSQAGRMAGVLTITLPAGVKAGQRFIVDVTQLQAGSPVHDGGFRVEIVVGKAPALLDAADRSVRLLHAQWGASAGDDSWRPVLARRLATERRRAAELAAEAGTSWEDPTTWTDDDGTYRPIEGLPIRVVLEEIRVLDDRDPWLKGAGEVDVEVLVRSDDNGGIEQRTRLPADGHWSISSGNRLSLDTVVFEGVADHHLAVRLTLMERDTFDPDDHLGQYTRLFTCSAETWLGRYEPGDEAVDPEQLRYFEVAYRIELA